MTWSLVVASCGVAMAQFGLGRMPETVTAIERAKIAAEQSALA